MGQPNDIPWWAALVTAIVTAIVSVAGTIFFLKSGTTVPGAPVGLSAIFTDLLAYIPHILLLFGVLADIFTMEGVYSIPSLIGLLSVPLNYAMKFFWAGLGETVGYLYKLATAGPQPSVEAPPVQLGGTYDGCSIQGLSWMDSPYAPQSLVLTATIFSFYMIDLIANRGATDAAATIVAFALFFGLQTYTIRICNEMVGGIAWKAGIALVEGLMFGGIGYAAVQVAAPNRLPSSVLSRAMGEVQKNPDGTIIGMGGATLKLGADGKPIIGSDGKPIVTPPTSATGTTGTGTAASQGSCPTGTR